MRRLALVLLAVLAHVSSAQAQQWADIKGRIVWGAPNAIPPAPPIVPPAGAGCPPAVPNGAWVVNPQNLGLQDTFVWLEPAQKGGMLPIHPKLQKVQPKNVEIDQPACAFIPNATAIREGETLLLKNTSPIAHNCKLTGDPTIIANNSNDLIPPNAEVKKIGLGASRLPIAIECNIHPWMRAWVRVFDHPYYAVTDKNGDFTIKDAPVGNFRMKIWHGSGGWAGGAEGRNGQPIAIQMGGTNTGDIAYPPPKE